MESKCGKTHPDEQGAGRAQVYVPGYIQYEGHTQIRVSGRNRTHLASTRMRAPSNGMSLLMTMKIYERAEYKSKFFWLLPVKKERIMATKTIPF